MPTIHNRWFKHQHIVFDCDSTLSKIEGIDELAHIAGVTNEVKEMTDAAMAGEINLEEVYGKRLELIKPKQSDITKLKQAYKNTATDDSKFVIKSLLEHGHDVYIVSGGLMEPVCEFGVSLGIKEKNIRAVGVSYNQLSGQWWKNVHSNESDWGPEYLDFHKSPLTLSEGKKIIIKQLIGNQPGRSMLIGDGMSDCLAATQVDQFIGYGGVVRRDNVEKESDVFIHCESLLPILALAGAEPMISELTNSHPSVAEKLYQLLDKNTRFREQGLKFYLLNLFN